MDHIRLNKRKKRLDFSNGFGFYLLKVCEYAVTFQKDKRSDFAVLIFNMTEPHRFKEPSEWEKTGRCS